VPDVVDSAEDPGRFVKGGYDDRQNWRLHQPVEGSTGAVP
jgi:hypothetical protein